MGIERTWFLVKESVYWKQTVKQCATCLEYQHIQPQERTLCYEMSCKPWEVVRADNFMFNNKTSLCIFDFDSKFPIVKKIAGLSADDLVQITKIICAEYGMSKKIILDAETCFTSETFKEICRKMNTQQSITSSYYPQSNGQVRAYLNFFLSVQFRNALILIRISV